MLFHGVLQLLFLWSRNTQQHNQRIVFQFRAIVGKCRYIADKYRPRRYRDRSREYKNRSSVDGRIRLRIFGLLCILIGTCSSAQADLKPLQFGMSTALSGPAAELGINMRDGLLIAFDRSNRSGGIRGRDLRLRVLDDAYEPNQTVQNLKQLVVDPRILAIVGNVGTPTAIAALPIIRQHQILFFAPFTGAGVLRRSPPRALCH